MFAATGRVLEKQCSKKSVKKNYIIKKKRMNHYGAKNQQKKYLKIILVGDSGVGKTCMVNAYFKQPFDKNMIPTIAPAYSCSDITLDDGSVIGLQIWDTAGQEKYNSVSRLFYREADFAFVCFETGNDKSLENVQKWTEKVKLEEPNCRIFFVMTKIDLFKHDHIKEYEEKALETTLNHIDHELFAKTSSLKDEGVEDLFNNAVMAFLPKQTKAGGKSVSIEKEKKGCAC